jgi:hypothetical protein
MKLPGIRLYSRGDVTRRFFLFSYDGLLCQQPFYQYGSPTLRARSNDSGLSRSIGSIKDGIFSIHKIRLIGREHNFLNEKNRITTLVIELLYVHHFSLNELQLECPPPKVPPAHHIGRP